MATRPMAEHSDVLADLHTANVTLEQSVAAHAAEIARLTAALEAAQVRADEAVRAKTRALAFMSQEIRVPVGAIVDAVHPLLAAPLGPAERERVSRILRSVSTLRLLLDDLGDLARLEADEITLEQEPFVVETVVGSAVSALREAAEERGLRVEAFIDPAVPAKVVGDAAWLRHVLVDLLGMALRDSDAPVMTVRVTAAALADGRQGLQFTVADAGAGLVRELRAWLDDAVPGAAGAAAVRANRAGARALGLHVCRRVLGLMGGALGVESDGTVWFTVAADPGPASPAAPRDRPSLSILVVEDNPVNQRVNAWLLEKDGHRVTVVGDGRHAVRLVATGGFDAVLMDLDVPGLDGFDATQAIRALGGPEAQVPVIAITASDLPEDIARCHAAGMDDHLPKPVSPAALSRVLDRLIEPDEPNAAAAEFDPSVLSSLEGVLGANRVRALVTEFLGRTDALRAHLRHADAGALADAAAELKKAAGSVGLCAVYRTAVALEHAAREGRIEAETLALTLDEQLARGEERLQGLIGSG
ncbi:response regulator [Azospirillum sp. sgz301742]